MLSRRAPTAIMMLAVPVLAIALGACSAATPTTTTPTAATPATTSATASTPPMTPSPIVAGPTTSTVASACPLIGQEFVHNTMGMRLGRITVQRSGGRPVGCRFYALQGGALHRSERLPGPDQPVVEIIITRWPSATAAHNAFVIEAERGTNLTQARLGPGLIGLCYQNDFDPHDDGKDFACAVNSGTTELTVRSVDVTGTFNTIAVTTEVLHAVQA